MGASTKSESQYTGSGETRPVPGALLIFSGNAPMLRTIRVASGPVQLGRDDAGGAPLPDEKASRQHAELIFDGPGWTVRELGSRNGTFVDGHRINGEARASPNAVLRLAQSVFLLFDDIRRFAAGTVSSDGLVIGPTLKGALDAIADAGRRGANLLITGQSGSGKEHAARAYHEATGQKGPFVAVNCSSIPPAIAEGLLFGARKGAWTDLKEDLVGHMPAANGGTLFLDEVAELDVKVQPKLLRAVEDQQVTRLGDTAAKKVSVRICAATHSDLRQAVEAQTFRSDLYYRLAQADVKLPPLFERREEIPWLVAAELADQQVRVAHASFVEAVLLRPWPGNVRELKGQVKKAAAAAAAEGSKSVRDVHLAPDAGVVVRRSTQAVTKPAGVAAEPVAPAPTRDEVVRALDEAGGKVAAAARALGQHRTQLYRLMERYGLERKADVD